MTGINPKSIEGQQKIDLALIPATSLIYMATGFRDGGIKYGPYNYRTTAVSMWTYLSPIQRHFLAYLDGQDFDPKTKVHHLAYVMCNCAIILDSMEQGIMVDDRPAKGKSAELMERFLKQGHLMKEPVEFTGIIQYVPPPSINEKLFAKMERMREYLYKRHVEIGKNYTFCYECQSRQDHTESDPLEWQKNHVHDKDCVLFVE